MKWTDLHTGSLFMLHAVIFLYSLPGIANADLKAVTAPKILFTSVKQLKLFCQVDPGLLKDETLVYWLVNDTFVETAFPGGRVQVSTTEGKNYIQSDLTFQSVQDIRNNTFTCVAMNPVGVDKSIIRLKQSRHRMYNSKKNRRQKKNYMKKHLNHLGHFN